MEGRRDPVPDRRHAVRPVGDMEMTGTRVSDGHAELPALVTVVIPARDEEASLGLCLLAVRGQTYPDLQIVVVDDGSTDATVDVVAAHRSEDPRVELLRHDAGSIPASLNLGLSAARGRWLVRVDAHSTIPPDYVAIVVDQLETGRWGGVGGRKDGTSTTPTGSAIAAALGSRFGVGNSVYHYGTSPRTVDHIPFGSYPVALLRSLGGWDERLSVNEDYELDYRIRQQGRELLFDPRLVIHWRSRETFRELWRQYIRYGRGKAVAVRLQPGTLRPRHLVAPGFVGSVLGTAVFLPLSIVPFAAVLASYVLAVVGASVATSTRLRGLRDLPAVALAFATMHCAWGLGFWRGITALPRRGTRTPESSAASA